jgi:bifunctional non-homologous end joining protein LigD
VNAVSVAGVALTHPDRVLYPRLGLTKLDLARYLEAVSPRMLPHVLGRPVALLRCPRGTGQPCFYQRHWTVTDAAGVAAVPITEADGSREPCPVVRGEKGLISLAQYGVVEVHPWGARADRIELPDRMVFDLDPGPGVTWARVRSAAVAVRDTLRELGLSSWAMTSGGKGLHVALPLQRRNNWAVVADFAEGVARTLGRRFPKEFILRARKAERKGRIYLDWLRNSRGATSIAPWSVRARSGAPVAMPVGWKELESIDGGDAFDIWEAFGRATGRAADPWSGFWPARQQITESARRALASADSRAPAAG